MTLTAHTCAGSAIAVVTGDPLTGFFVGLLSHHVLDAIAHSDLGSLGGNINNIFNNKKNLFYVLADILFAFVLFVVFAFKIADFSQIFWSVGGAILPDVIDNSPFWSKYTRKIFPTNYYHKFHETVHCTILKKKYFWVGIATQLVVVLISLYYIYNN